MLNSEIKRRLTMKDLFSGHSALYQKARPTYPKSVIDEILKHVQHRAAAWDCGAGSGQFTQYLSPFFDHVDATDLSEQQLAHAPQLANVTYKVEKAEQTTFAASSFDLVTVAQAIHWFNFDAFYRELKRVLKPDGIFAIVGYGLLQIQQTTLNDAVQHLYWQILNGYWDRERHYVDEHYQTIPFPFKEISTPHLKMYYQWNAVQLLDYLNTWSAIKHYQKQNTDDPLQQIRALLDREAPECVFDIEFPILLRVGQFEV